MRIPKINEKIFIKNIPEYKGPDGKAVKVIQYSLGFAYVKPPYWKGELIEVPLEEIDFITPDSLSGEEKKKIINEHVKLEYITDFTVYHREMGILNKIIEKYPDLSFWREYFVPDFQVKSLIFYLASGKDFLKKRYNEFTIDLTTPKTNNTTLNTEKIGEDVVINSKPKNLIDFLD